MTLLSTLTIPSPHDGVWNLGPVPIRGYALSILSRALVFAGRADEALMDARAALDASTSAGTPETSAFARLALAEAFEACGDRTQAARHISRARAALLARAQGMPDEYRRTFLENIPEHRRTLELAAAWSAPELASSTDTPVR